MLNAQTYLELVRDRGNKNLELRRVYQDLRKRDLFLMAYGKLYANKGAMTPGTDLEDNVDGMSIERIEKVIQSLQDGTFRWKPSRRTYVPKADGRRRPIGIPSWTDKLVQEAIRLILETYYEPRFSTHSHGFRPKRGCHTALEEIIKNGRGTTWFIEGDIKGCFDNIDHELLLEIIGRDIKDPKFLKLLKEMLKAGYLEDWIYRDTYSGTPQGGIISPLLSNIFLNELDKHVESELLPKYNKGTKKPRNPEYRKVEARARRARQKGDKELAEKLGKQQRTMRSYVPSPEFRRLRYTRYADDFILSFIGPKAEATEIKEKIRKFLETIDLTMSDEKTLITHASSKDARFLGYDLRVSWVDSKRNDGKRTTNGEIHLRTPKEVITQWKSKYQSKGKTVHIPKRMMDSDYDIVMTYNSGLTGLVNYYTMALNVHELREVKWIMETSMVKTLAAKHKQKTSWVYKQHKTQAPNGLTCLEVKVEREGKDPLIARFGAQPIRYNKFATKINDRVTRIYTNRTQLVERLLADTCELCGSTTKVEVHHIKSIKSLIQKYKKRGTKMPWWVQKMAEMYRKTLVVCRECHNQIHNGNYDGRKLV